MRSISRFPVTLTFRRSTGYRFGSSGIPSPLFAGVELVAIDEVSVRIYSVEKTIADCFKYRNKIGLDIAIEALRTYQNVLRSRTARS